jgi:hypothetical protein
MTQEEKIELLQKTKMLIEKEIYTNLIFLGIDPDSFVIEGFNAENFRLSAPDYSTPTEHLAYFAISRFVPRLNEINLKLNEDI